MVAERGEINHPRENEQQTEETIVTQMKAGEFYFTENVTKIPLLMNLTMLGEKQ